MNEYESITEELAGLDPINWSGGEECCFCGGKASWNTDRKVTVLHEESCLWWRAHQLYPDAEGNSNADHREITSTRN